VCRCTAFIEWTLCPKHDIVIGVPHLTVTCDWGVVIYGWWSVIDISVVGLCVVLGTVAEIIPDWVVKEFLNEWMKLPFLTYLNAVAMSGRKLKNKYTIYKYLKKKLRRILIFCIPIWVSTVSTGFTYRLNKLKPRASQSSGLCQRCLISFWHCHRFFIYILP